MNPFSIGDRVECIEGISPEHNGPREGDIFIVKSVSEASIGFPLLRLPAATPTTRPGYQFGLYNDDIRNGVKPNWGHECFRILPHIAMFPDAADAGGRGFMGGAVGSDEEIEKKNEIDDLLKTANEGRRALEKLMKLKPYDMEIMSDEERHRGTWRPLNSIKKISYRVKSKYTMKPWKTQNGWDVSVTGDNIVVGCQTFNQGQLRHVLQQMIENNQGVVNMYINPGCKSFFDATKKGIKFNSNVLYWPDAEKLMKELKRLC